MLDFDHGFPIPSYLTQTLDELAAGGLLTLALDDAGGLRRLNLTEAGNNRYAQLNAPDPRPAAG